MSSSLPFSSLGLTQSSNLSPLRRTKARSRSSPPPSSSKPLSRLSEHDTRLFDFSSSRRRQRSPRCSLATKRSSHTDVRTLKSRSESRSSSSTRPFPASLSTTLTLHLRRRVSGIKSIRSRPTSPTVTPCSTVSRPSSTVSRSRDRLLRLPLTTRTGSGPTLRASPGRRFSGSKVRPSLTILPFRLPSFESSSLSLYNFPLRPAEEFETLEHLHSVKITSVRPIQLEMVFEGALKLVLVAEKFQPVVGGATVEFVKASKPRRNEVSLAHLFELVRAYVDAKERKAAGSVPEVSFVLFRESGMEANETVTRPNADFSRSSFSSSKPSRISGPPPPASPPSSTSSPFATLSPTPPPPPHFARPFPSSFRLSRRASWSRST